MADQLYLSYRLDRFRQENMLRRFEKMLRTFPVSRLTEQGSLFRIRAVDPSLPPLLERVFEPGADPADIIATAREFLEADISLELETFWDLWQWSDSEGWKLLPSRVVLICYGPGYDHEPDENLRIDFGVDSNFLPQPDHPNYLRIAQSNIRSLLKLVHDLDDALEGERRLWSDSGENFAEKLQRILAEE